MYLEVINRIHEENIVALVDFGAALTWASWQVGAVFVGPMPQQQDTLGRTDYVGVSKKELGANWSSASHDLLEFWNVPKLVPMSILSPCSKGWQSLATVPEWWSYKGPELEDILADQPEVPGLLKITARSYGHGAHILWNEGNATWKKKTL